MLVEYARTVLGIDDADHAETNPSGDTLVVTPLSCSLAGQAGRVRILPSSRAGELYGRSEAVEDYFCNYGLNPLYRPLLERRGLRVTGVDDDGQARIVELEGNAFFIATLFCFQTRSRPGDPHPLVRGLVAAARERARNGTSAR